MRSQSLSFPSLTDRILPMQSVGCDKPHIHLCRIFEKFGKSIEFTFFNTCVYQHLSRNSFHSARPGAWLIRELRDHWPVST